jgi:hypothetical protein
LKQTDEEQEEEEEKVVEDGQSTEGQSDFNVRQEGGMLIESRGRFEIRSSDLSATPTNEEKNMDCQLPWRLPFQ